MMQVDALRLAIYALAVYRVSYMATLEAGPFKVFQKWRDWLDAWDAPNNPEGLPEKSHWIVAGFHCVFCLSFWVALPAALAMARPRRVTDIIAVWMALSAITLILRKRYQ